MSKSARHNSRRKPKKRGGIYRHNFKKSTLAQEDISTNDASRWTRVATKPICPEFNQSQKQSALNPKHCVATGYCDDCGAFETFECLGCPVNRKPIWETVMGDLGKAMSYLGVPLKK